MRRVKCPQCDNRYDTCTCCCGTGHVYVNDAGEQIRTVKITCPECDNRYDTCTNCCGTGFVRVDFQKLVDIEIEKLKQGSAIGR
jgi:hypothetical protein